MSTIVGPKNEDTQRIFRESMIGLEGVPPHVPFQQPTVETVRRWGRKGIRGVRLEVARVGRRYITSVEAVERFLIALQSA